MVRTKLLHFGIAPLFLAMCLQLFSHRAFAQGEATPREQYRKAHAAMDRADWAEARQLLRSLYEKTHAYDVAATLSEVEYELQHYGTSANCLAFAIANLPPHEKADRLVAALESLKPLVATVNLTVNQKPDELLIDDDSVCMAAATQRIFVGSGPQTITARRSSLTASKTVQLAGGSETSVLLEFPVTPTASEGSRKGPNERRGTPPSSNTPQKEREMSRGKQIALISGSALTLIGLSTGIGFGLASNSAETDAKKSAANLQPGACLSNSPSAACQSAEDAYDRQRRSAAIANVGFAVGLTAAVATVACVLLWPDEQREQPTAGAVRPAAVLAPGMAGLSLDGRF